jgi:predicted RNA-binding protein with PUA-like domain
VVVDLEFVTQFDEVLSLAELKEDPALEEMLVVQKGQRLSVQPVEAKHWRHILKKVGIKE